MDTKRHIDPQVYPTSDPTMPDSERATSPLGNTLLKFRRNPGGQNKSTNSLTSESTSDDPNASNSFRASIDEGIGKLRDRARRKPGDERRGSRDSPLSGLMSGRKNKVQNTASTDLERHLSVDSHNDANLEIADNRSDSSLGIDEGLLTDDNSDVEG